MRRLALLLLLVLSTSALGKPPRLTLFISVDALGTDLLLRNRAHFKSGLATLLAQGAFFPNARFEQAQSATAVGHAALSTGAYPWRTGVTANRLVNRRTGKEEPIFWDPNHPVLEAPPTVDDVSPEALLAETLGDHLRIFTQGAGKAVTLSIKARAAIAMAGRLGQAYWFNDQVGKFVTGTYYAKELPSWLKAFNDRKLPDAAFSRTWDLSLPAGQYVGEDDRPFESPQYGRKFPHALNGGLSAPGPQSYAALAASPMLDDVLVQLAKAAIAGENLGKDDVPDLLNVSFSPIDVVYHLYGPYSWEMQDALLRLDRSMGELLAAAEKAAGGRSNLLVVLSADHGGAAIPEEWIAAGASASRLKPSALKQGLNQELSQRFGAPLVLGISELDVVLNPKAIADKKLDGAAVRRAAADWLSRQPQIALAVARDDLGSSDEMQGWLHALRRTYYPDRSGDVLFLPKPFVVLTDHETGANHSAPYGYDAQVPVLFAGKNVKPGTYRAEIHPVDAAPTAATLMEMGLPSSSEGVPRSEALVIGNGGGGGGGGKER